MSEYGRLHKPHANYDIFQGLVNTTMHHYQYLITSLWVSGLAVPSAGGDLIVVVRNEGSDIDWELIHRSSEEWHLEQQVCDLVMQGPADELSGPAVVVRSDGRTHVFRGVGTLDGFSIETQELM